MSMTVPAPVNPAPQPWTLVQDAPGLPVPFRLTDAGKLVAELEALYTAHNITVLELPEDGPHFGEFLGYYADVSGVPVMVFPAGQDLRVRLQIARTMVARREQGAA